MRSQTEADSLTQQADPQSRANLFPIILDVTSQEQIDQAVVTVQKRLKEDRKLSFLVNNAGICEMGIQSFNPKFLHSPLLGSFESMSEDRVRAIFDVNYFGPLR